MGKNLVTGNTLQVIHALLDASTTTDQIIQVLKDQLGISEEDAKRIIEEAERREEEQRREEEGEE